MTNIPITDQWLLNGECAKCRRNSYCKKDCTASKKHINAIMRKAFEDTMEKYSPGYKEIMKAMKNF